MSTGSAAQDIGAESLVAGVEAYVNQGKYGPALAMVDEALVRMPGNAELLAQRAGVLSDWGRAREALTFYLEAASRGCQNSKVMLALGWCCQRAGNLGDAANWMQRAIAADPGAVAPRHALCQVLMASQRIDEVLSLCEDTLQHCPNDVRSLAWIAEWKLRAGDSRAAEHYLRRALGLDPGNLTLWINLSACLRFQHRTAEALQALEQAQARQPDDDNTDAFVSIAVGRRTFGQLEEALEIFERNLAQRPAPDGHRGYSHALLYAGRLAEGWDHNEFRWLSEPFLTLRQSGEKPAWSGQDLGGKTVLLRAEQGYGDAIQFVRYARHVKALGATVVLEVFKELKQLMSGCVGVDQVVARNEALPPFDYYVHLLTLPTVFSTDASSIPAEVPYLVTEPGRAKRWADRLATASRALRVGVVWAGGPGAHARDRERSIDLASLEPLLNVSGVQFFSLQKGPAAGQLQAVSPTLPLIDLGPDLEDFADTAAAIDRLDLVISVDTAVAHLAGALGKPVWVLLRKDPDWRWILERERTPWYPTMRLFHQREHGTWADVIEQVRAALERWTKANAQSEASAKPVAHQTLRPKPRLARLSPGHKPGFSAVAETRVGIVQYFPDEPLVGDSISWYGEYQQRELDFLRQLIRPGTTLLEVDSGVGLHSLYLAAMAGPAGRLLAYEPRLLMQRVLRQNLAANRVVNVTPMARTLGRAPQTGGAGESIVAMTSNPPTDAVDELRLDELRLLKIGANVAALDVLEGAAQTLWRSRPLLFISVRDEAAPSGIAVRVKDFGYRCWKMETPLFNPYNFNRRENDIFPGLSSIALIGIAEEMDVDASMTACTELS